MTPILGPFGVSGVDIVSGMGAKLAVIVLLALIVDVIGLDDPLESPVQLLKAYSALGVAVRVTWSP